MIYVLADKLLLSCLQDKIIDHIEKELRATNCTNSTASITYVFDRLSRSSPLRRYAVDLKTFHGGIALFAAGKYDELPKYSFAAVAFRTKRILVKMSDVEARFEKKFCHCHTHGKEQRCPGKMVREQPQTVAAEVVDKKIRK